LARRVAIPAFYHRSVIGEPLPGLRRARVAVIGVFLVHSSVFGSWAPRVPAIKDRLGLGTGHLGLALLAFAAAAFAGTRLAGPLIARFGSAWSIRGSLPVLSLSLIGPSLAGGLPTLVVALSAMGVAGGFLDVAMNAQAVAVERSYGRPIMSGLHASWSIGMLGAGVIGTGAAALAVGPRVHFGAVSAVLILAGPVLQRGLLAGGEPRLAMRSPGRLGALGSPAVLLLGAIAFSSFCGEGAASDWSAVYLHERLHSGPGLAGAAFVAFALGIAGARLVADRFVLLLGPVRVVQLGAALAAVALALGLAVPVRAVALVGFALFGIGLAPVVPAAFSAAGGLGAAGIAGALGWVVTFGYVGGIAGPAAIGFLAQHAGLRIGLLIPAGLAALVAVLAGGVRSAVGGEPQATATERSDSNC
jgi:MFS family permease